MRGCYDQFKERRMVRGSGVQVLALQDSRLQNGEDRWISSPHRSLVGLAWHLPNILVYMTALWACNIIPPFNAPDPLLFWLWIETNFPPLPGLCILSPGRIKKTCREKAGPEFCRLLLLCLVHTSGCWDLKTFTASQQFSKLFSGFHDLSAGL